LSKHIYAFLIFIKKAEESALFQQKSQVKVGKGEGMSPESMPTKPLTKVKIATNISGFNTARAMPR